MHTYHCSSMSCVPTPLAREKVCCQSTCRTDEAAEAVSTRRTCLPTSICEEVSAQLRNNQSRALAPTWGKRRQKRCSHSSSTKGKRGHAPYTVFKAGSDRRKWLVLSLRTRLCHSVFQTREQYESESLAYRYSKQEKYLVCPAKIGPPIT